MENDQRPGEQEASYRAPDRQHEQIRDLMRRSAKRIKDKPIGESRGAKIKEDVHTVLSSLSERERTVLMGRFGLEDGRNKTQKEIGQQIGKSARTVGRIEKKALTKLRHIQTPTLDLYIDK